MTEVTTHIVDSLKASPVLLGLLVLNTIGIGAAVWFLERLTSAQGRRLELLMKACLPNLQGTPLPPLLP